MGYFSTFLGNMPAFIKNIFYPVFKFSHPRSKGRGFHLYIKKGYNAPTRSLKGISIDLVKLGYKEVENITNIAFLLHDYQYNGFDPDFSKYKNKDEVLHDIILVSKSILNVIKEWFKEEWDKDLDKIYEITSSDLLKLETEKKVDCNYTAI